MTDLTTSWQPFCDWSSYPVVAILWCSEFQKHSGARLIGGAEKHRCFSEITIIIVLQKSRLPSHLNGTDLTTSWQPFFYLMDDWQPFCGWSNYPMVAILWCSEFQKRSGAWLIGGGAAECRCFTEITIIIVLQKSQLSNHLNGTCKGRKAGYKFSK